MIESAKEHEAEYSILSIAWEIKRAGSIISNWHLEDLENSCRVICPVDLKGTEGDIDRIKVPIEEKDLSEEEKREIDDLRYWEEWSAADSGGDKETEDLEIYRLSGDLFILYGYGLCGGSNDAANSGGVEWEIQSIGFEEVIEGDNDAQNLWRSDLAKVIEVCRKKEKEEGTLLTLWGWEGHTTPGGPWGGPEFDSYAWYIGEISGEDLEIVAQRIREREDAARH